MKKVKINIIFCLIGTLWFPGALVLNAQFVIMPGSSITIKEGSSLYLNTNMVIDANETASGHFCDQTVGGNSTVKGGIIVERYLTKNAWHNTSSPVSNNTSAVYTGTELVFYYDESIIENDWDFGWAFHQGTLNEMKGYDVFLEGDPVLVEYTALNSDELNTGSFSINVTRTNVANGEIESHKGWNLVGNPYPSPVDWTDATGWDKSAIVDAKYIWDPTSQNYSVFLGGKVPDGVNGGSAFIPANQGFWVQAIQNGVFKVNNAARRGMMENTPGFYKNETREYPLFCLLAEAGGYYDETKLRFIEGSSEGYDVDYDALKMPGTLAKSPQISTGFEGRKMAINTLPECRDELEIPLSFYYAKEGVCQLKLMPDTSMSHDIHVYLKDLSNGEIINLSDEPCYQFMNHPEKGVRQFVLIFNPSEDLKNNISESNAYKIYTNGNTVFILKNTSRDQVGKVMIFDVFGRCVDERILQDINLFTYDLQIPAGCYLAQVSTHEFQLGVKVWINGTY